MILRNKKEEKERLIENNRDIATSESTKIKRFKIDLNLKIFSSWSYIIEYMINEEGIDYLSGSNY